MATTSKPVDIPAGKAEPVGPGEPVEMPGLSQMGGTFAERQAAREGKKSTPPKREHLENSTFATRAKAVRGADAEDKSVKAATAKHKG